MQGVDPHPTMSIIGKYQRGDLQLPAATGFCPEKIASRVAKVNRALDSAAECKSEDASRDQRLRLDVASVEWQWLYGYGAGCRFRPGARVVAVRGENASGKSAFADIVMLGLFGKESDARESKQHPASVICRGKPDDAVAWTEVAVTVEGSRFRIRREFVAKSGGKMAQTAMVTMDGSGAVMHTGKAAVDAWVSGFVGPDDFLLIDRRDRDLLSLRSADQKALMDAAMRTAQVQAELDAVDESRRAHKWLGDGLLAAAEAGFCAPDDPADEDLSDAMLVAREAALRAAVVKAQLRFAEAARRAASEKRELSKRVALVGPVEPRPVPERELEQLEARRRAAEKESRAADSALRASERAGVSAPPPLLEEQQESVEYLEEKTAKYQRARSARARLDGLGRPCAFNDGCWACAEREGANVSARADCESLLLALGVAGTSLEDIGKKCRGYERRLQAAVARAEAAERHRAWSGSHDNALAHALRKRDEAAAAVAAAERARLENDLHLRGGDDVSPDDQDSGLVEELSEKLEAARRAQSDGRVKASELRALRRAANSQRARSKAMEATGRGCLDKAASLKASHAEASQRFEEQYCEAVERLSAEANAVLEEAYGGVRVRVEWSSRSSFVFWMSTASGVTLPVEKASGFERSAVSVAVKAALRRLGYGCSCGWMMIDEATAGYDDRNASRIARFLGSVAEHSGASVIALTHQTIAGVHTEDIEIRNGGLSLLRTPG